MYDINRKQQMKFSKIVRNILGFKTLEVNTKTTRIEL